MSGVKLDGPTIYKKLQKITDTLNTVSLSKCVLKPIWRQEPPSEVSLGNHIEPIYIPESCVNNLLLIANLLYLI